VVLNKLPTPKIVKPGIAQIAARDLPKLEAPKLDKATLEAEKQAKRDAAENAKRIKKLQQQVENARKKNGGKVPVETTPIVAVETPITPDLVEMPNAAAIREMAQPVEAFSTQATPVHDAARPAPDVEIPAPVLPQPIVVETRTTTFVVPVATTSLDTSGLEERLTSLQAKLAGIRSASRAEALRHVANDSVRIAAAVPAGGAQGASGQGTTDPRVAELLARLDDTVGLIQSINRPANQAGKEEA
jgi:hypothetical protein